MIRSQLINQKLEEYKKHCILALDFYYKNDFEHSLTDFRKSAEAFMKIPILNKYGDNNGLEIILGKIDCSLNPINNKKELSYQELLNIIKNNNDLLLQDFNRLKDIQKESNPPSHNSNSANIIDYKSGAELCKVQSLQLTKTLYSRKANMPIPPELSQAYEGTISDTLVATFRSSDWEELLNYTDSFSSQNKYILVAPPKFIDCSNSQIQVLSRINWSFVIDFDSQSKENGLFKSFEPIIEKKFKPITLKQKGQKGIVGSGSYSNVNWFFANGLKTIPDTVTSSIKDWRKEKYHTFIKELFNDFFSKSLNRYFIIYLWDDLDYIEEIVRVISEIDEVQLDLINHAFVSKNNDILNRIKTFDKYDIKYKTLKLSTQEIIGEVASTLIQKEQETEHILVPARTKSEEQTVVDISNIYHNLLDNYINVIHKNIEQNIKQAILINEIPSFYKGEQISWKELSIDLEVKRSKYNQLLSNVKSHLSSGKKSLKYELFHKPGAGGTTISRRIAYDLRNDYPTIVITRFDKHSTYKTLSLFIENVNKPILAIIEALNVGINDIDELIRSCNANKQTVLFLYIRRSLKKNKDSEFSTYLNDTLVDIDEREKFISKLNIYSEDKSILNNFVKKQPSECEVIDFSLAINEKEYNTIRLVDYIKTYIDKIPENQVQFIAYISIIYYYSQKSVSELIFRSLFKKSLSEELHQIASSEQYIRKIIIQEYDQINNNYTEYWRPRFSKFAETVLMIVLGGKNINNWKEQLPFYSTELIKIIKKK